MTDEVAPPPVLMRAGMGALPSSILSRGERAGRRFIEFFTANIRNRNTRLAYARALRTTNALERINEEFRRRTKTQASLPGEDAVLLLLFGLLRSGQIVLRRMDGWQDIPKVIDKSQAA